MRAARNSGTIACAQPGGPGTPVDVTITGADTTGYTVPTENSHGGAIPATSGVVVSLSITVEIPRLAVQDLGSVDRSGSRVLTWRNTYTDIEALGLDGTPAVGEDPSNNTKAVTASFRAGSGPTMASKGFIGVPGTPGNTAAVPFSSGNFAGPPGSGTMNDGNTVVVPGQLVISAVSTRQQHTVGVGDASSTSSVVCDVWDDDHLGLAADFPEVSPTGSIRSASGGASAWLSHWGLGSETMLPTTDPLRNYTVEYGYAPDPGAGAGNDCSTGTWAPSPDLVPGATTVDGAWAGINRVRYSFTSTSPTTSVWFSTSFFVGMKVLDSGAPVGTKIGNWTSVREVPGVHPMAEILSSPTAQQRTSAYDPQTHLGQGGDRLILGSAAATVRKFVRSGITGPFSDTAVPQVSSGSSVEYRLNPALAADVDAGTQEEVILEDCLPASQVFDSSRRESGAAIEPTVIRDGAPAGSQLVCPEGQQYLRWDLGPQTVNAPIDPVVYAVQTLTTARNGVATNTVLVSVPNDPRPVAARQDTAQVQLVTPRGIALSKTTTTPVVEVNPAGVATPRLLRWRIEFSNLDNPATVGDVDVIDVLPVQGEGRTNYTGGLSFLSTEPAEGTGVLVRYTSVDPALLVIQPDHPSNAAGGSTVWCDAPAGGTVVSGAGSQADCPGSAAEVTGLRFFRAGPFEAGDTFAATVSMVANENADGDVYQNRVAAKAQGVTLGIGPNVSEIRTVGSEIGDRVWEDLDGDGLQDDDEPGLPGVVVRLTGTDVDANPVDLTTTTDADGAYVFAGLASGTYEVTFAPDGLPADWTFTQQHVGDDSSLDSDADPTTGASGPFALAASTVDHSRDAGIVVDRDVDVSMVKEPVAQSDVQPDGGVDVTYRLTVTNRGTAQGVYDLDDTLHLGEGITPGAVAVTGPEGVVLDPAFDGQTATRIATGAIVPGGGTHVYEVTVHAVVDLTTTTSAAADCEVTETESGSGLLNSAMLTVGTKTTTDDACGPVILPRASLGDRVWLDLDSDGIQDDGEPGVSGVLVTLAGTDVDGSAVSLTTTTDADGRYLFADLAAGDYLVTFDHSTAGALAFTAPLAGTDRATDSDADAAGRSGTVSLAWGEDDLTVDAGLIETDITVEKTLTSQREGADTASVELVYTLEVTNTGRTSGRYDLTDTLRLGQGITPTQVSARGPDGVILTAGFDGVTSPVLVTDHPIDGGAVHTYVVEVSATVATTTTRTQADCTLTTDERGTGFLNEAAVTVADVVVVDTACGQAHVPPAPPAPQVGHGRLAVTGATVTAALLTAAALLLGGTVLVRRRRRGDEARA